VCASDLVPGLLGSLGWSRKSSNSD